MNSNPLQRLLLPAYLMFFLNFGPSFHRAPVFGLHDNTPSQCCCGQTHGFQQNRSYPDGQIKKPDCDCSLCSFFQNYNASLAADTQHDSDQIYLENNVCDIAKRQTATVVYSARGPPTL